MKIQCGANAVLFETRQSTHATGERKITNYKTVPGKGLERALPALRPAGAVVRQELEAGEFELVKRAKRFG